MFGRRVIGPIGTSMSLYRKHAIRTLEMFKRMDKAKVKHETKGKSSLRSMRRGIRVQDLQTSFSELRDDERELFASQIKLHMFYYRNGSDVTDVDDDIEPDLYGDE